MSDFEIVWNSSFFGITVGEMALASLVLFAFILTRKFFARVVIERLKRWASLTKTDIDDQIVIVLQQPLMFLFFIKKIIIKDPKELQGGLFLKKRRNNFTK